MKSFFGTLAVALLSFAVGAGELQDAARLGDLEKVRALIAAHPAAINARVSATTALHEAVRAGQLEVVKLLVASGADVNTTNDFSRLTPLKMAIGYRQTAVAEFLRQKGGVEQVIPVAPSAPPTSTTPPSANLFPNTPGQSSAPVAAPVTLSPARTNANGPAAVASRPAVVPPNRPAPGLTNRNTAENDLMAEMFLIHDAARDGDSEKIKTLFKNTPVVLEATSQKGLTPLHIATMNRRLGAAQTLLDLHANVNARTITGQTPLHLAVRNGDVAMTTLLLKQRAEPDARDKPGDSPLWMALQSPEAEAAATTGPAQRKAAERTTQWAALIALEKKQLDLVTLLVQARADVKSATRSGGLPLAQAVRVGNASVAELLLQAGAEPNTIEPASGKAPLHLAATRPDSRLVDLLLRHRATVNLQDHRGETPLGYAMREGRTNSITVLRGAGGGLPKLRTLNASEQSLADAYQKNEFALQRAGTSEKGRLIIAMNPTQADCQRMFPQHAASAWTVVAQLNAQIKEAFSKPLFDAEGGREIWRILPESAALLTREWQGRGWLAPHLPVFSLAVDKVGSATRPGEYCFVNGHWVLVPPLHRIAAEYAAANQRPGK